VLLDRVHLALEARAHRAARAVEHQAGVGQPALAQLQELAHARREDALHRRRAAGALGGIGEQVVQVLAGPELALEFLANVGSISPYVGLLGTVAGIMVAFVGLANMQSATIATVAPGIAEALVATAMGLIAAIPAVWAYNRFSTRVERIVTRYDTFVEEFSSILQRQAHLDDNDN